MTTHDSRVDMRHLERVDDNVMVEVALELHGESEPISGRLCVRHGPETEFSGVLELLELLDKARHSVEPRQVSS